MPFEGLKRVLRRTAMNWKIEYDEREKYVRITSSGVYDSEEHMQLMKEFLSADFWKPGTPVLIDDRRLDLSEVDLEDLKKISHDMLVNNERIGNSKIAFLVSDKEDYNLVRQFELITEEDVSAWMHVFMNENQALRWLSAHRSSRADGGSSDAGAERDFYA